MTDIHANAVLEGKTDRPDFTFKDVLSADFVKSLGSTVVTILKHNKFNECSENKARATSHMMVLYGFIGCAIVTGTCVLLLYGFNMPGPYSQLTPLKWLANVAGIAIVIGASLMIKERLAKKDQLTDYKDWFILVLVLALGVTGLGAEMTRLAGAKGTSFFIYWLHLISVFVLFAYLPYSKMAHLVYRTFAMAYTEYSGRK
jgi:quinone-modifying oxidoreductase subunit QmoC